MVTNDRSLILRIDTSIDIGEDLEIGPPECRKP